MNRSLRAALVVALPLAAALFFSARAQSADPVQQPAIRITPPKLEFPSQPVNTESAPAVATVTNLSADPVTITDILVSGIDFAETTTCGQTLSPSASCIVSVTFTPVITGPRLGTLTIIDSAPGSPRMIGLSGTGK